MNAKSCAFCASTGYDQQLPRMRPTWRGWTEPEVRQGGLQMFSDDEVYVVCNDCQVGHAFAHWVQTGIWVPPQN